MSADLLAFVTARLNAEAGAAQAMRDLDWPREVWVTPADMQGTREGDGQLQGSVSVHEYAPKRYARLWAAHGGGGVVDRIEHGWVVHETAQEVWSEDVARTILDRVAALRAVVAMHEPEHGEHPAPRMCLGCNNDGAASAVNWWACPTLRALASAWRSHPEWRSEWSPDGAEVGA